MQIKPFKLISFDAQKWNNPIFAEMFNTSNTKDKITRVTTIMNFIQNSISNGSAKIDRNPGLYVLQINNGSKNIKLLIGSIGYDEKNIFLPNEETHPEKINSYTSLFNKYKMQINPVLTFYKEKISIDSIVQNTMNYSSKIDTKIGKSNYKLWTIKNPIDLDNIKQSMDEIKKIYIADGHHRFSIFQHISRKTLSNIMIALTDSHNICLKSCHRIIIANIPNDWKEKISDSCIVQKGYVPDSIRIIFRNGEEYSIKMKPEILDRGPINSLINDIIFKYSFNINNIPDQIFPLPGNIDQSKTRELFDLYEDSTAIVFIPDLDVSEFFTIVDNGNTLPPTSTWFEPKIIDGFLMTRFGC